MFFLLLFLGFSSSLPNGVNVNMHFNRSPLELDDFTSDISVGSSLSSSMGKSGMGELMKFFNFPKEEV